MILISLQDVGLGFGGTPLLESIDLQIKEKEKVALIGRNGEGKSTLLKIIEGQMIPDKGEILRKQGLQVSSLPQEVPQTLSGSVFDILLAGLGKVGETILQYNALTQELAKRPSELLTEKLTKKQQQLDEYGGWKELQNVEEVIARLNLEQEAQFENLSAGKKRRVLLARALVKKPELLLLDEPTNHLDIPSIQWLEDFFKAYEGALLLITHDRRFLQRVAERIVELDRGRVTSWDCSYDMYLERREAMLQAEEKHQREFDRKLAQEEAWLRKGIKARRTRNQGRVKRLKEMREQYQQRRKKQGAVRMVAQSAQKSGNLVIHAENVSFAYPEREILTNFSTTVMRGDKIGIIGPNGCGKTTLLKVLLGKLPPQQGEIHHGTNLQIAYFDQLRNQLEQEKSMFDNIGQGGDTVVIQGQKKHVMGYLQDFLFSPKDAYNPVKTLSGGEQNRLMLAKLFLQPSNVLVLDEPTNDLDFETLELQEQLLVDYPGTVFVVSHDRSFLNNVVTHTLVFENGTINEYVGGYDDWLRQRPELPSTSPSSKKAAVYRKPVKKKGLTYKEKRELEKLPLQIEDLEEKQQQLYDKMAQPTFYQQEQSKILEEQQRLEQVSQELENAYARWEQLEEVQEGK